jgi:AGZA family xanthine/uracil permease-like MFS transporter
MGKVDLAGALTLAALPYMFTFFAAEFFSTLGTTLAIGAKAGLTDEDGNLPGIEKPFLIDLLAATLGPLIGVPGAPRWSNRPPGSKRGPHRPHHADRRRAVPARAAGHAAGHGDPASGDRARADPDRHRHARHDPHGSAQQQRNRRDHRHVRADGNDAAHAHLQQLRHRHCRGLLVHVLVQLLAGRWREIPPGLFILTLPLGYYFYGAATAH